MVDTLRAGADETDETGTRRSFEGGLTLNGIRIGCGGATGVTGGVGTGGPLEAGTLSVAGTPVPFGEIFATIGGPTAAGSSRMGAGATGALPFSSGGSVSRIGLVDLNSGTGAGAGVRISGTAGAAGGTSGAGATGAGEISGAGATGAKGASAMVGFGTETGTAAFPKRLLSSIVACKNGVSISGTAASQT